VFTGDAATIERDLDVDLDRMPVRRPARAVTG
jgi:hypothetical protein